MFATAPISSSDSPSLPGGYPEESHITSSSKAEDVASASGDLDYTDRVGARKTASKDRRSVKCQEIAVDAWEDEGGTTLPPARQTNDDYQPQTDVTPSTHVKPDELPDQLQLELMAVLSIVLHKGVYHFGGYRYERLADAVNYARHHPNRRVTDAI